MQIYFDGWIGRFAPALGFLLSFGWQSLRTPLRWRSAAGIFLILLLAGFVLGGPGTWAVLAIAGLISIARSEQPFFRLLLCAFLVLSVLTPCYAPFARLLLPWVLIANLLAGMGVRCLFEVFVQASEKSDGKNFKETLLLIGTACILLLLGAIVGFRTRVEAKTFGATDGIRHATKNLMTIIPKDAAVFVTADPEIAFYFRCAGYHTDYVQFIAGNGGLPEPLTYRGGQSVYVVGSYYARIEPNWVPILTEVPGRFQLIAQAGARPGDVRLLDDFSTREAWEYFQHPDERYDLLLFRMHSIPESTTH